MKAIARVFQYEFKRSLARRSYLFVTIGIPIIALVIFYGIQFYQQTRRSGADATAAPPVEIAEDSPLRNIQPMGYVDLSGLLQRSPFTNLIPFESEAAAMQALQDERISAYYVIHADYLDTGAISMYVDRLNLGSADQSPLRMLIVNSLAAQVERPVEPQIISLLQSRRYPANNHTLTDSGEVQATNEDVAMGLVYVFALVLMISTFTTSGYLMQSVVEEKETRMVEILLSSMRPRDLLAGKFLALSILGLVQMFAWGATVVFIITQLGAIDPSLAGLTITPGQLAVLAIYFVLGYLFFGSGYAAIGALATNMREGPQLAVLITLPAVLPLYALTIIATAPNGPLAVGLSLFPVTAPMTMVMRAAITEVPIAELLISMALLSLTIAGMIWLAGRLFRVNTLLSGQMPKFKDILRLVRENV